MENLNLEDLSLSIKELMNNSIEKENEYNRKVVEQEVNIILENIELKKEKYFHYLDNKKSHNVSEEDSKLKEKFFLTLNCSYSKSGRYKLLDLNDLNNIKEVVNEIKGLGYKVIESKDLKYNNLSRYISFEIELDKGELLTMYNELKVLKSKVNNLNGCEDNNNQLKSKELCEFLLKSYKSYLETYILNLENNNNSYKIGNNVINKDKKLTLRLRLEQFKYLDDKILEHSKEILNNLGYHLEYKYNDYHRFSLADLKTDFNDSRFYEVIISMKEVKSKQDIILEKIDKNTDRKSILDSLNELRIEYLIEDNYKEEFNKVIYELRKQTGLEFKYEFNNQDGTRQIIILDSDDLSYEDDFMIRTILQLNLNAKEITDYDVKYK